MLSKKQEDSQNVIILQCGGTINMSGATGRKASSKLDLDLDEIREKMRRKLQVNFISEKVFDRPPDSSNIGEKEWDLIFERIKQVIDEKERVKKYLWEKNLSAKRGGIVITHGTDTLQICSFVIALKFSLQELSLPIIFTASHLPPDQKGSDAKENIKKSLFLAAEKAKEEENLPPGVYVLIGQELHLASRISKLYTVPNSEGKYFFSFPAPVAFVPSEGDYSFHIHFDKDFLVKVKGTTSEELRKFEVTEYKQWGIVEHIVLDRFSPIGVIKDFIERIRFYKSTIDLKDKEIGLVIQGNFSRNKEFTRIVSLLRQLDDIGIVVFVGSKEVFDQIEAIEHLELLGLIHKSLSHSKARTKLSWLFKLGIGKQKIVQLMSENIAGDIFETSDLPDWIADETFPESRPANKAREVLITYPSMHWKVLEDAVHRLNESEPRDKRIYLYGFGDGHIPAVNKSIKQMIQEFLISEAILYYEIPIKEDDLENLIKYLCRFMREPLVREYLLANYRFAIFQNVKESQKRKQKQALPISVVYKDIAQRLRDEKMKEIKNEIFTELSAKLSGSMGVWKYKLNSHVIDEVVSLTATQNTQVELERKWSAYLDEYTWENKEADSLAILLDHFPHLVAKRIIKDSVMKSSILMSKIGNAIDRGIKMEIRTSAIKSLTNTSLYENGNLLMVLGVDSDECHGWDTSYMKRVSDKG